MAPEESNQIKNHVGDEQMQALVDDVAATIQSKEGHIGGAIVSDSWRSLPENCKARRAMESGKEPACRAGDTVYVNPAHPEMCASGNARFVLAHEFGHIHRNRTRESLTLLGPGNDAPEEYLVDRLASLRWGVDVSEERFREMRSVSPEFPEKYRQFLAEASDERALCLAGTLAREYYAIMSLRVFPSA